MPAARLSQQVVSGTNLTAFNATTAFTIAWWHRWQYTAALLQAQGTIFQHGDPTGVTRNGYAVGFNASGQVQAGVFGSAGATTSTFAGPVTSRSGRWNHYAVTFDDASNTLMLYVDGKLQDRQTNTRDMTSAATSNTYIGAATNFFATDYRGVLFDVQVFNDVVIAQDDVPHLMNPFDTLPGICARFFGVNYQQLAAGTLRDETGNGNNLTVTAGGAGAIFSQPEPPFRFTIA